MHHSLRGALAMAAGACTLAGLAYSGIALMQMRRFRRTLHTAADVLGVPVTVLKPLRGLEPRLYENLSSFCRQRFARYQIIFGAADAGDPALAVARRVARDYPQCDITIVAGRAEYAANPKVGNLLGMMPFVKHPIIVLADSDIEIDDSYLSTVTAGFTDPQTGAVTCLYGAVPRTGWVSQLAAMYVNESFAPSVLVARAIEPLNYAFGATIAVRAGVLEAIGGLSALRDYIGDDYMLGRLVARAGYRVTLAPYVVQTDATDADLAALWAHELRWARTIRLQRPAGYAGSVITNVLPFAFLFAAASRCAAGYLAFALAALVRVMLSAQARKTFAPSARAGLWLVPVRDVLSLGVWCAGLSGHGVTWRTRNYNVQSGGRMDESPVNCNDLV
ncbi:MAG TPA: bacteriohopanetetrol glucosamine biosynthesis glycosyltransferase HpnI [Candidatus Baltobacteraceae bacterium]|jgi:ceramide glucosyltransferase|nr:bacteriohopanetetrol glucosamine biosynthesis glycosyltransferase HpnI [Candidatus Baltobacteraceae bacterium]